MPAHRKSTQALELSGAFKRNPSRARDRANEPQPSGDIGEPPAHLSESERACWHEILSLAHAGSLCRSDRLFLEHGARVLAQVRAGNRPTLWVRWESFLARAGLTPSDRSRVSAVAPPAISPYAEFAVAGRK